MSDHDQDRDLEQLLAELAPTEAERELLLEEHRQLEKDLLRLADPPPPPDFVNLVMARVAVARAAAPSRAELVTAGTIISGALIAAMSALLRGGASASSMGLAFAQLVVNLREAALGLHSALFAVWHTAALPISAMLAFSLVLCVVGLRRVGTLGSEVKVAS